jgi:hypothetical protein
MGEVEWYLVEGESGLLWVVEELHFLLELVEGGSLSDCCLGELEQML